MNTPVKSIISAMFGIAVLTACGNKQVAQDHHQAATTAAQQATDKQASDPKLKDAVLNAMLPYYNRLQQGLVANDMNQAKEAALLLEEGAKQLPQGKEAIQQATDQILRAEDIEGQRQAFANLSEQYISLVKTSGVSEGTLFIAHCPMAFKSQGANWLSMEKSLKNPYFGDKMLSCGTVAETLD